MVKNLGEMGKLNGVPIDKLILSSMGYRRQRYSSARQVSQKVGF